MASLDDYEQLRIFDKRNLTRGSRLALTGVLAAGVVGTGGLMAAQAISGGHWDAGRWLYRRGGNQLRSGVARWWRDLGWGSRHGRRHLRGRCRRSRSWVCVGSEYHQCVCQRRQVVRVEKFRDADPKSIIIARGFVAEVDQNSQSADWNSVERRYPDSPIYRLHWESKELGALLALTIKA